MNCDEKQSHTNQIVYDKRASLQCYIAPHNGNLGKIPKTKLNTAVLAVDRSPSTKKHVFSKNVSDFLAQPVKEVTY